MSLKKTINYKLLSCLIAFLILFTQVNIQKVLADTSSEPTIVSAATDHIGKKIVLTFDRAMKDPTGTQDQFKVTGKYTAVISGTPNFLTGNVPVTGVTLGSDSTQIILSLSTTIQPGAITLDYTKGSVQAADGTELQSLTNQSVTNNNICGTDVVDFDYDATEIEYDTSNPSNPILKYRFDKPVDYDNVQLAWYMYNGFFRPMVDDLNNYVKFYEKDTGNKVVLPNILTSPNAPAIYKDGSSKSEQIVTDWYFWQLQHYAPLGLNLVSQALKPSTTYVIEIEKGFLFNNNATINKTISFEFTTTTDSLTKPYWTDGSSVTASDVTENSLKLEWTPAQDNHGVAYTYVDSTDSSKNMNIPNLKYNIYQNGVLLDTVDGNTTSYNVSNLSSGTQYNFQVEAVDFANNHSSLDVTKSTKSTAPVNPAAPNVTADDANNSVSGMTEGLEYNLDNVGYLLYDASTFNGINFGGNHKLLVRVAALGTTPAGFVTTLTFTNSSPRWSETSKLTAGNITENSLKLNWSGASDDLGVTAYKIYKDDSLIGTVDGDTTSYDVIGLDSNTEYTFKVEAVDSSNDVSTALRSKDRTVEKAITDKVISDNGTGITVKGDMPTEASKILVQAIDDQSIIADLDKSLSGANSKTETYKIVVAYDLSLLNDSNIKIQPNGTISISIPLDQSAANKNLAVFYVDDNGVATNMESTLADGVITFTTTHFIRYVIAEVVPVTSTDSNGNNSNGNYSTSTNGSTKTIDTVGTSTPVGTATVGTETDLKAANVKTGSIVEFNSPILISTIMALAGLVIVEARRKKRFN